MKVPACSSSPEGVVALGRACKVDAISAKRPMKHLTSQKKIAAKRSFSII